jgi:hypothetical protein
MIVFFECIIQVLSVESKQCLKISQETVTMNTIPTHLQNHVCNLI